MRLTVYHATVAVWSMATPIFRIITRARWVATAWLLVALCLPSSAAATTLSDLDRTISQQLVNGRTDLAAALVNRALALAHTEYAGDSLAVATYADSLGIRFFEAHDYTTGVHILEHGVKLRESVLPKDDPALAGPLEQLATAYYIADRLADAVAPQERALAIRARALGANDPLVASSRYELSLVYYQLTRYADAGRELRAALATFESTHPLDSMSVAKTRRVLGEVCRETNRYEEAEQLMTDALSLARSSLPARDPDLAVFLNSVAGLYKDQARYDEAEPLIEEDVDIRARAGLEDELATPTLNLAEIYRLQGRYDDAIPLYQRALEIARKTMPPLEVSVFQNQIASAYAEMGRPRDAEAQYRRALEVIESSKDASPQVVAQYKNDLGVLLVRESRPREGEALLTEAIGLREKVFGSQHPLVAVSLTQLARAKAGLFENQSGGDDDAEAARLLDRALAIFDSTNAEPESRVDAGVARAQLYAREGHVDRAAATMADALGVVESLRPHRGGGGGERTEFVRRYVDAYDRMTEWQLELKNVSAALDYSERRRARVLVDRLIGTVGAAAVDSAEETRERLRAEKVDLEKQLGECHAQVQALRAKARLSTLERSELASAEARRDHLVDDIERTSERLRRLENSGNGVPAKHAPARIAVAKGEALLAYHIGTRSSDVFVIEGGSSRVRAYPLVVSSSEAAVFDIPAGPLTRATIAQLLSGADATGKVTGMGMVRELSEPARSAAPNSIMARAQTEMHRRLHALFVVLMPPDVWKLVHPLREVAIVPDGPLAKFPLEACVVKEENTGHVVFWLDDGPAIRYAPSIAALDALGRVPTPVPGNVLSVCNPAYATTGADALAPLPGTTRESEAVVSAFGATRVTVLSGSAATEAAVRDAVSGRAIIHLATHGIVDQRRSDLLAALAFTPGPSSSHNLHDDGFLHLFEIYDLPVSAQLVVLSACESSAGNYVLGEGVMAMSRGFLSAGARRVVATEWKVDDDATAALVGDFFARIAKNTRSHDRVDYALALRDAKRSVRRSDAWSQPFYWAAFVLTGVR